MAASTRRSALAIDAIQVPITVASAWTLAISGFAAHALTTGPSDVAVEASMFGQVASIFDAKSAQKPSRATDGTAPEGMRFDGTTMDGAPLVPVLAHAETRRTAPPRSPRSERRYDMGIPH